MSDRSAAAVSIPTLLLIALAGCDRSTGPQAPMDPQACFRMSMDSAGKAQFVLVSTGDPNLQTCAVHLEGKRLEEGRDLQGAYEGQFIYATRDELAWSAKAGTPHFPVLSPGQRAEVDKALQQQIEAERRKTVAPAAR